MKKHAMSVLIVFLSVFTFMAERRVCASNVGSPAISTYTPTFVPDSFALVALYNQCNGINWTKQTNWLTGPVSNWQGVTVENGRVVGLNLGDQPSVGLTGT